MAEDTTATDGPLATATIGEIWEELRKRYDAAIFVYYNDRDANNYHQQTCWKGPVPTVLGLCDLAKRDIHEYQRSNDRR